jgi:hypothetical protein
MKRRHIAMLVLSIALQTSLAGAEKRQKEKFNGYIEWVKDDLFVFDGQSVRIAASTKVKLRGDVEHLRDVPLGYEAKGKGFRLPDGVL